MQSAEILEWAAPYQNNVLFCERNLQNFSHPLRPSNTSCFPPGWDNSFQGHFCDLSWLWKQQVVKGIKMSRGGRKSYPNIVEPQKKFQPGVEQDCRGFFIFFRPQSSSPVPIDSSGIPFPVDCVTLQRASEQGVLQEESSWTVMTSQSVGEEGLQSCWNYFCASAPSRRHRGVKGCSGWGPTAATLSGCYKAVEGYRSQRTDGEFERHKCGFNLACPFCLFYTKCFWGTKASSS